MFAKRLKPSASRINKFHKSDTTNFANNEIHTVAETLDIEPTVVLTLNNSNETISTVTNDSRPVDLNITAKPEQKHDPTLTLIEKLVKCDDLSVTTNLQTRKDTINSYKNSAIVIDTNPELCKEYNETGYCGYGDSCIFIHDRIAVKNTNNESLIKWNEFRKKHKRKHCKINMIGKKKHIN